MISGANSCDYSCFLRCFRSPYDEQVTQSPFHQYADSSFSAGAVVYWDSHAKRVWERSRILSLVYSALRKLWLRRFTHENEYFCMRHRNASRASLHGNLGVKMQHSDGFGRDIRNHYDLAVKITEICSFIVSKSWNNNWKFENIANWSWHVARTGAILYQVDHFFDALAKTQHTTQFLQ